MVEEAQDVTLGTRVSSELVKKIEMVREQLAKANPGVKVSVSDAVRALIERGIASMEDKPIAAKRAVRSKRQP
jgi:hypothetical protein